MTDRNEHLERQLADVANRVVGPERHVDAIAVARGAMSPADRRDRSRPVRALAVATAGLVVLVVAGVVIDGLGPSEDGTVVGPAASPTAAPTPSGRPASLATVLDSAVQEGVDSLGEGGAGSTSEAGTLADLIVALRGEGSADLADALETELADLGVDPRTVSRHRAEARDDDGDGFQADVIWFEEGIEDAALLGLAHPDRDGALARLEPTEPRPSVEELRIGDATVYREWIDVRPRDVSDVRPRYVFIGSDIVVNVEGPDGLSGISPYAFGEFLGALVEARQSEG